MLASRGLLGRDGDAPDAVCGPFGGICQPASSAPYCLVFDSYADGSWAMGPLVTTPAIRLAGVDGARVAAPLFAAVAEATPDFFESPQGGGIWGLAMGRELGRRREGDCGTPCLTPLLDRLWEDGGRQDKGRPSSPPPNNRFSIVGQGDGAAVLIVGAGGEDPATAVYRDGSLRYVPLRQPWGYYIVGVTGLEIAAPPTDDDEGKDAGASEDRSVDPQRRRPAAAAQYHEPAPGGRGAVLDSGTTGLFFSAGAFAFFRATLQARFCHVPYICLGSDGGATTANKGERAGQTPRKRLRAGQKRGEDDEDNARATTATTIFDGDDALVPFTEEDLAQLPTLTLLLQPERAGDAPVRLEVAPAKYLARIHDGEGTALYALSISAVGDEDGGGDGSGYLLGQALLNNYFVEFDRQGKRVGFAPAVVAGEG